MNINQQIGLETAFHEYTYPQGLNSGAEAKWKKKSANEMTS